MKKTILNIIFIYFLLVITNVNAQVNLVSNGDFEIYSALPTNAAEWYLAVGWNNVNGTMSGGTPDYCYVPSYLGAEFGAITPYSGNGQMGMGVNSTYREYISTQLAAPMIPGNQYSVSFYLTNGSGSYTSENSSCNNYGVCFSNNPLQQPNGYPILLTPQLEIDTIIITWNIWEHFYFTYISDSSYKYITFGNFRADSNTLVINFGIGFASAYYFIDKIEIYHIITIKGDTNICVGNATTLKIIGDSTAQWADSLNPNTIITTDSIITVTPTTTTTYMAYGATDTASFTVHVISPPNVNLGNDTALCQGQTLLLNATTTYATYQWQDNSTDSIYKVTQQGTYWVKVTNQYNCIGYDTINVNYNPLPIINLGNDTVLCSGKVIVLNATNTSSIYHWQDSTTYATYNVTQAGIYWVKVINQYNCSITDTINITYKECEDTLVIPNIFTPNGDGSNDNFVIKNIEYWNINLQVFNRWGNEVYKADNYQNNWDGKYKGNPLSDGTYFYIIKAKGKDSGSEKEYKGSLMIMR